MPIDAWAFEEAIEQAHSDAGQPIVLGAYNSIADYHVVKALVLRESYSVEDIEAMIWHFDNISYLSPGFGVIKAFLKAILETETIPQNAAAPALF